MYTWALDVQGWACEVCCVGDFGVRGVPVEGLLAWGDTPG